MRTPVFFAIFIPILTILITTLLVSYLNKKGSNISLLKYVYPALGLGLIIFIIIMTA
jgi:hypothetical protein